MASWKSHPRIVIVGAGMAGLSAAAHLMDQGLTDVTVLEAANRIGGRIHTVQFGDSDNPVELGANWIHGASRDNSTFELADKLDVLRPYRMNNRGSSRFMKEDGAEVDRDIVKDAWQMYQTADSKIRTQVSELDKATGTRPANIQTALDKTLKDELLQYQQRDPKTVQREPDMLKVFNSMTNYLCFHEADELDKVTWEDAYFDMEGGNIHIPKGYIQLLQYLVNRLPTKSLHLNSEVKTINMSKDSQRLSVTVGNGSVIMADHVIVTCSLGYLKQNHTRMFDPPLPHEKQNALSRLGMGRVNKIFLNFDQPVTKHKDIVFAWDHTDIGKDKGEWYRRLFGFENVFTRDTTLLGWIAGDAAEYMETLTNEKIGETCVTLLRQFLQDPFIPYPKDILVSRWCSDPYSNGSYSYISPAYKPGDQTVLAEPILSMTGEPRIMFAGEATVQDQYSCTHGARDSGTREAMRLYDMYIRKQTHSKL